MASRKLLKSEKDRLVAKVIEEDTNDCVFTCVFCHHSVNDEVFYGKLYSIGDLYCHYFCVLLSCCLVQKGDDTEGLLGFLYTDIVNEVDRSQKHKCSYCNRGGATLGCAVAQCRKQFHLPCGRARGAVSMYYGNYKSFCEKHAPRQKIESTVMEKAQARLAQHRKKARSKSVQKCATENKSQNCVAQNNSAQIDAELKCAESNCLTQNDVVTQITAQNNFTAQNLVQNVEKHMKDCVEEINIAHNDATQNNISIEQNCDAQNSAHMDIDSSNIDISIDDCKNVDAEQRNRFISDNVDCVVNADAIPDEDQIDSLCVICYEPVDRWPGTMTFWPPCCARDAWLHRDCLQRMALSAGMHYLKCPLCNDKNQFFKAVVSQGYYVPDRDAAWELEQNAFAEIYERELKCDEKECKCPQGRGHDAENGDWDIQLCLLCGSAGAHRGCRLRERHVCAGCQHHANKEGWDTLEGQLETLIQQEQIKAQSTESQNGPIMPSRMSIRRTKGRLFNPMVARGREDNDEERKEVRCIDKETRAKNRCEEHQSTTESSRLELNLKSPRHITESTQKSIQKPIQAEVKQSPMKLLEKELYEKIAGMDEEFDAKRLIDGLRLRLTKPQPLSVKKRMVNGILDSIFKKEHKSQIKSKQPARAWLSPRKEYIKDTGRTEASFENKQSKKMKNLSLKKKIKCYSNRKKIQHKPKKLTSNDLVKENDISKELKEKQNVKIVTESDVSSNKIEDNIVQECANTKENKNADNDEIINKESDNILQNKSTTVDIELNSSFEISENDESIKIDLVKIESIDSVDVIKDLVVKSPESKLCMKLTSGDKEVLHDKANLLDLETFKNQYLNEVERDIDTNKHESECDSTCLFNHKHEKKEQPEKKLRTAIDFAMDVVSMKNVKSKNKKNKKNKSPKIKLVYYNKNNMAEKKKIKKKNKKLSKNDSDLSVEINWREERLKIKINQTERKRNSETINQTLKQTVLKFSPESSKEFASPEKDATPRKRMKIKHEKADGLKQMSIENFFKAKTP